MTEKTLQDRIDEVKAAQAALDTLDNETGGLTSLIEQYKTELIELKNKRDDQKKQQELNADLIIAGKLSKDDFSKGTKYLSDLYTAIDEAESLLEKFEHKLQSEYPKKYVELNQKLVNRKQILRTLLTKNLAEEIARQSGEQLRELAALAGYGKMNVNDGVNLGQHIAAAVFGGSPDSPKAQHPDEKKQLFIDAHKKLGI